MAADTTFRRGCVSVILAGLAAVAGACGGGGAAKTSASHGTLVITSAYNGDYLDPGILYSSGGGPLLSATNDGLVTYRHTSGPSGDQLVPDLATAIPQPADGGRTWTFHLRGGVRYSTGQPVVASDVRRTIERDFKIGSLGRFAFGKLAGAPACFQQPSTCSLAAGIVADDAARTVTFHLTSPDFELPFKLALPMAYLLPAGTPDTPALINPLPATGPYRIAGYRPGQSLVMVRNPQFHVWSAAAQPAGYPDRIVVKYGLSTAQVFASVKTGQAAWAEGFEGMTPSHLASLTQGDKVSAFPETVASYAAMNTRVAPFDDARVRKALRLVLDPRAFAAASLAGTVPLCHIVPPGVPGHIDGCHPSAPRWSAARRLVQASGTAGAKVAVVGERGLDDGENALLVADLKRLGYRASRHFAPAGQSFAVFNNPRSHSQAAVLDWGADYPSPASFLDDFAGCEGFVPGSAANADSPEFCNQRIERMIVAATAAEQLDPASQAGRWAAIDRAVAAQAPVVPLSTGADHIVLSRSVGHVVLHPVWGVLFDQLHP